MAKFFIGVVVVLVIVVTGAVVVQRMADGPSGPIAGGKLKSGELVQAADVNWEEAFGDEPFASIELELVSTGTSRITGAFVHEGSLYIPCDLGYLWRRAPETSSRLILGTIWLFKDWHEKAAEDGRVVIRLHDKLYNGEAVRVMDEVMLAQFRGRVESAAAEFFGTFREVEVSPEDIWFFRVDPV